MLVAATSIPGERARNQAEGNDVRGDPEDGT